MSDIVIYGASQHGKYTIDIVERAGEHRIVGVVDDRAPTGTEIYGYPVLGSGAELKDLRRRMRFEGGVVAIGDNFVRSLVVQRILDEDPDFRFIRAIHPFTSIGRDTKIGEGTVIMAGAVINGSCSVGRHAFIATNASLDHDSELGDYASLSPGATTGGAVRIGNYSSVSIGATVIHGRSIGDHTIVGAGSTVIKDLPSHVVAYGSPCQVVRSRDEGDRYL